MIPQIMRISVVFPEPLAPSSPPDARRQPQADVIDGYFVFEPFGNMVDQQFHVKTPFPLKK